MACTIPYVKTWQLHIGYDRLNNYIRSGMCQRKYIHSHVTLFIVYVTVQRVHPTIWFADSMPRTTVRNSTNESGCRLVVF